MKKFLSLVLALVMTMSLVTISAGAAEYKDLTDKDEITYEEAVSVLNRLGIITGYSDGSFQPKTELTRGAAAKIIVSLLIGTDAANNLVASTAPYTDVPVDHTFAGVISYCKNSNIINGYADGSFRPGGSLSGYAFTKMLLGALGYKSEYEGGGFTGAGWTMNVARLGNEAGLFDRLTFKGNETVNREQACQLALNTLKATLVEYSGGLTVTAGDASVTGAATRGYKTSNQDYATHIYVRQANVNQSGWYTVEFGEEHFVDLRLEHDNTLGHTTIANDLGQPSAEWSYKKVTIGTYPLAADFTYTEQKAHEENATDAAKVRALGLDGYTTDKGANNGTPRYTRLWLNGDLVFDGSANDIAVADIADYTDNGVTVEVYVDDQTADFITDVVVIQTQLMEVRRVGSDYVSLQKYDDNKGLEGNNDGTGPDVGKGIVGFNQDPLDETVENVEINDRCYEFLSGLKAGDIVAVVPVADNHDANSGWKVWDAYTPETVSGKLTKVTTYGKDSTNRNAVDVTVGGTAYKIALWNKDLKDITAEKIQVTVKDITLYLDKGGNAMLAKDVGDTSEYMVVKGFYQATVNNRIVEMVEGWDMSGNELSLNLGSGGDHKGAQAGDLVQYTNVGAKSTGDWALNVGAGEDGNEKPWIYDVNFGLNGTTYEIKSSNTRIALKDATVTEDAPTGTPGAASAANMIASGIKFIYVNFNQAGDEVESIEIIKGVQNVSNEELQADNDGKCHPAQAYTDKKGAVKAVVIKDVSSNVISNRVAYIRDWDGEETYDNGKRLYRYTVALVSPEGYEDETKVWTDTRLEIGNFASYTESTREGFEPFYRMHKLETVSGKVTTALYNRKVIGVVDVNSGLIRVDTPATVNINAYKDTELGIGDSSKIIRVGNANWLYQGATRDMEGNRRDIRSAKELDSYLKDMSDAGNDVTVEISFIFNDNVTNDGFRDASLIIVRAIDVTGRPTYTATPDSNYGDGEVTNDLQTNIGNNMALDMSGSKGLPLSGPVTSGGTIPNAKVNLSQKQFAADYAGNNKTPTSATITFATPARAGDPITASGTVRVIKAAQTKIDAVEGKPAEYRAATVTSETFASMAGAAATTELEAGLWIKTGENTYRQVDTDGTEAQYSGRTYTEKPAVTGLYTKSGSTYTPITKWNSAAVWDDGTLGSALTNGWADGVTYYTTKGDTSSAVDTSAVSSPDADTTYYTITTAAVEDGTDFSTSTTYYTKTADAIPADTFAQGTTYYQKTVAVEAVEGRPAQAGEWEITFTVPNAALELDGSWKISNVALNYPV